MPFERMRGLKEGRVNVGRGHGECRAAGGGTSPGAANPGEAPTPTPKVKSRCSTGSELVGCERPVHVRTAAPAPSSYVDPRPRFREPLSGREAGVAEAESWVTVTAEGS
jgi:hypothetical protein